MENAIYKKKEIIKEINNLGMDGDFKSAGTRIKEMEEEFKVAGYAGKENSDLFNEFVQSKKDYYERFQSYKEDVKNKKNEIIREISNLSYSKESTERVKELCEKYNSLGYSFKEIEPELFEALKSARKEYYEKGKKLMNESASKKENLISQLSEIASEDRLYRFKDKINSLKDEWKGLGFSGERNKELNDAFYQCLSEIRRKQNEEFELFKKRKSEQEDAARKKQSIIDEVISFINVENPSSYISNIYALTKDFYSSGFAPKEINQSLTDEFNRVKGLFFEEVTRVKNEKIQKYIDSLHKRRESKERYISILEDKNSDYHCRISALELNDFYEENKATYEEWISNNEEKIRQARDEMMECSEKIVELRNKIK